VTSRPVGRATAGILFLVIVFTFGFGFLGYHLWKILALSSLTAQYKEVKPYQAAVRLVGEASLPSNSIRTERLEFCSYAPIRLCVRILVENSVARNPESLEKLRQVAKNACAVFDEASASSIASIADERRISPEMLRTSLRNASNCALTNTSLYTESMEFPIQQRDEYMVLTLIETRR
jgi:hypothetical protein